MTPEFKVGEGTPTELMANSPEDADEFPRERSPTAAPFSVGRSSRDTGGSNPPRSASQFATNCVLCRNSKMLVPDSLPCCECNILS